MEFFKITTFSLIAAILVLLSSCGEKSKYKYETVPGDPMQTRIYTLDNGLKVFLTVYKDEPRIQTYIPVKVGSKNDPSETTGLAHYFEHMMFKGTPDFGTQDWQSEKVLVAQIEDLFEIYRNTTDEADRAKIYHQIDSLSFEASKIAIPNEYDKLMQTIGSNGTNAWTSNDATVYVENIPANQIENWAKIQVNRFTTPVLRLFHTELETIYEEKNMSLTQDGRRLNEAMLAGLFPNHPYGQQTTLGSQEHLKNPSMKNIREFFAKYYVANNMAVVLSGDFDFDETIAIIDKYFSALPSGDIPKLEIKSEPVVTEPIVKEVVGLEAEQVRLAFRIDEPGNSPEMYILDMLSTMMYNGKAGIIDMNLNQKQKVYASFCYSYDLCDNSALVFGGMPKTGQSLDDVKNLLLEQISLLKQGQFEDWMLKASIDNMRLQEMKRLESNQARANWIVSAFTYNIPWETACKSIEAYEKITKEDVVKFANKHLNNNYVIVYKRQGTPTDIVKVAKPPITPIEVNRDAESNFLKEIKAAPAKEIAPVFVDFNKDLEKTIYKGAEILSVQNKENKTFSLYLYFPMGTFNDLKLPIAIDYLDYLGTSNYSPEQIKQEFYKLACNFGISADEEESYLYVSGLSDNMEKALALVEQLLTDPQPNEEALNNVISDILKTRADAKTNQSRIFSALTDYGQYGKEFVNYKLSDKELMSLTSEDLLNIIKNLSSFEHQILYYGPEQSQALIKSLEKHHKIADKLQPAPQAKEFLPLDITKEEVFFAPYDTKQSRLATYSRSVVFDQKMQPIVAMYNEYFGGGMNSIVFQEMREKRSLAYTARSNFSAPDKKDDFYKNTSFIGTQNDKIIDAFDAFNELFNEIPLSETAFTIAKDGIKTQISTNRITKMNIIWRYIANKRRGVDHDPRKDLYDAIPAFTLNDVATFNNTYVKGKPKLYFVLSKTDETDFKALEKYGAVKKLTLEEIFGY